MGVEDVANIKGTCSAGCHFVLAVRNMLAAQIVHAPRLLVAASDVREWKGKES